MAVRLSALPAHLPPVAHVHQANFKIRRDLRYEEVLQLVREIFGDKYCHGIKKGYGGKYSYGKYYTIKNTQNAVLVTILTNGTGTAKNTTAVWISGLCWETWSALNPFQPLDIVKLAAYVFDHNGWFTRIDLAKNDYRRITNWDEIKACSLKATFRDRLVIKLNKKKPPYSISSDSDSIYYGSNKSRTQILAYNKAEQQETKFPWIRFELKVRGKSQCNHAVQMLIDGKPLDNLISGILAYYLDYKVASSTTKGKRPSCKWWTDFVGTEKIKLKSVSDITDIADDEDYLEGIEF